MKCTENLRFRIVHRVSIASSERKVCTVYGNMLCARKNIGLADTLHWKFIDLENIGYVPNGHLFPSYTHMALKLFGEWAKLNHWISCDRRWSLVLFRWCWSFYSVQMIQYAHTLAGTRTYNLFYSIFVSLMIFLCSCVCAVYFVFRWQKEMYS